VPRGPRPPYLAVADALRERIDAGEWLPGEALPSVAALSAEYEVSTSTAGRAIRVLADEGRVTTVQGWGSFVSDWTK
jgi:GntR family transcriptional regulator